MDKNIKVLQIKTIIANSDRAKKEFELIESLDRSHKVGKRGGRLDVASLDF